MLSFLSLIFGQNFHTIIALFCILIISVFDRTFTKKGRAIMLGMLLYVTLIFLNNTFNSFVNENRINSLRSLRFASSSLGYIFEPLLAFLFYAVICRPLRKYYPFLLVPIIINSLIFIVNVAANNVFTISEDNIYVVENDLLICVPFIVPAIYFICIIVHLHVHRSDFSTYKVTGVIIIMAGVIIATVIEKVSEWSVLDSTLALSTILFYLMGYIEQNNKIIVAQKEALRNQRNALLLSQIHPHFIYNTLNSIYYLCRKDSDMAAKAIMDFSDYLHGTLDLSLDNELISFSQEIETTTLYTNLEKMRFEDITVEYQIEEKSFLLPPLSVQPLVENSIRHGIRGKKDGFVRIKSVKSHIENKDYYVITIEDNGKGIPDVDSEGGKINYSGEHSGIGMKNVKNRIESLVKGSFDVVSSDQGTLITITIPCEE